MGAPGSVRAPWDRVVLRQRTASRARERFRPAGKRITRAQEVSETRRIVPVRGPSPRPAQTPVPRVRLRRDRFRPVLAKRPRQTARSNRMVAAADQTAAVGSRSAHRVAEKPPAAVGLLPVAATGTGRRRARVTLAAQVPPAIMDEEAAALRVLN